MIDQHSSTPKIRIIIPTYTAWEKLELCLASVEKFTDLSDSLDVLVVCNGAPPETRTICHKYPVSYIWSDAPLGFTCAVNLGIEHSQDYDYIVLFNDDCELLPQPVNHWIERLYAPFSDDKVALTGPLYDRCPSTGRDFFLFFCVMIRKTALDALGGKLDEAYNPGAGEDCAFCHDAEDAGWKLAAVGGEPVWADRGDPSLEPHQQGQWCTTFPLFHLAGCTVAKLDGWSEIFTRNSEILRKRYSVNIERAKTVEGWMADSELEWLARQAKRGPRFHGTSKDA